MKAVILAAGEGTRMRPLTESTNKVLVPVAGQPFLYHVMERLKKAGFDEFGVIVGYKRELVAQFLKDSGYNATAIDQGEPLGTGHAVKCAREFVGKDNFIVLNGDGLWSPLDLARMRDRMADNTHYVTGLRHEQPENFGVLKVIGHDMLESIVEKPQEHVGNLISTGLYKFTPDIFDALDRIKPVAKGLHGAKNEKGEYLLPDAVNILASDNKVRVMELNDDWRDFGKPEDVPVMEEFLAKDR